MQVTAAHEYYHAVQFAYDYYEDADHGGLVLDVWDRLDGAPGGPDDYSMEGLAHVLSDLGTRVRDEFRLFAAANQHPGTVYEEGHASAAAPTAFKLAIGRRQPNPGDVRGRSDHLTSASLRSNPRHLDRRDWKLKVVVNAPRTRSGSAAVVVVYKRSGRITTSVVGLDERGDGPKTVPFTSRTVRGVDVVLVNASTRYNCWEGTRLACQGLPHDNNQLFEVDPRAFRS